MIPELYNKCKELGYCDCGGFLGCVDDDLRDNPGEVELAAASRANSRVDGGSVSELEIARAAGKLKGKQYGGPAIKCEDCAVVKRKNHNCKAKKKVDTDTNVGSVELFIHACGCESLGSKQTRWCDDHKFTLPKTKVVQEQHTFDESAIVGKFDVGKSSGTPIPPEDYIPFPVNVNGHRITLEVGQVKITIEELVE